MSQGTLQPIASQNSSMFEPVIGDATENLGRYLVSEGNLASIEEYQRVRSDALAIIRRCVPFSGPDATRTGLVVGYVQSGKTMSMETVVSLARDNGCRLVVMLAGVTKNLLKQNAERFQNDLRNADGAGNWHIVTSQDGMARATDEESLKQACVEWRDSDFPEADKRTFIFAVLKNHAHLDWMRGVLQQVDLKGIPALILDDEADQAGLNVNPDDEDRPSTTYARILELRTRLPHHTYLQYTATPQAPLLISIDDQLSPAFAELVQPGTGYTGGEAFFGSPESARLVRNIPAADHFKPGRPPSTAPDSLLEAFAVFAMGCAVARTRKYPKLRSMLVHPSPRRADHEKYMEFITNILGRWRRVLAEKEHPDRPDTLDELRLGYDELKKTVVDLPSFDDLLQPLRVSLSRVSVKVVNSEDASEVDWQGADEHILVGGEKLNRGYTVEGLMVTYMPRDAGGWNADTLQQRARFFGYKSRYLDFCRLYLHPDVAAAFRHYLVHERDIRKQLASFRGRPLREWRRAFFMDASMKPTRKNVLSDQLYQKGTKPEWWRQTLVDFSAARKNSEIVMSFLKNAKLTPDPRWSAAGEGKHRSAEMPLRTVMAELLSVFSVPNESWSLVSELMLLTEILDSDANAKVLVVSMDDAGNPDTVTRTRSLDSNNGLKLFQGRSTRKDGTGYAGDESVRDAAIPTVQIHKVTVQGRGATSPTDVFALALFLPSRRVGTVVQESP